MKRILFTGAGGSDPYTKTLQGVYNDGSIISIIRQLKKEGKPITDVYLYLSYEMAMPELIGKAVDDKAVDEKAVDGNQTCEVKKILRTIKSIDNNINVVYFPLEIEAGKDIGEIEENINKIARKDVNEFGTFYSEANKMLDKVKQDIGLENSEIYVNVSSGTSAMESDFNLMAITNNEIGIKICKVNNPTKKENGRKDRNITGSDEEIQELNKQEKERQNDKEYEQRANEVGMENTKKLILLNSLEDSFKKHDFTGAYNAIMKNKNIIKNKRIINYAANLYYRYIGNDIEAKKVAKNIEEHKTPSDIDLYPLKNKNQVIETLIEKFNVMKVKFLREEFNDWLLISTPIIEKITTTLLVANNINLDKFTNKSKRWNESDLQRKISIESFEKSSLKENQKLREVIKKNDGQYLSAYRLVEIIQAGFNFKDKEKIIEKIRRIDTTRKYRIIAAHDAKFVELDEFEKNYAEDITEEYQDRIRTRCEEKVKMSKPDATVDFIRKNSKLYETEVKMFERKLSLENENLKRAEVVHNDIKFLLNKCLYRENQISNETNEAFENVCDIYNKIQERIITLLKNEINSNKERNNKNGK